MGVVAQPFWVLVLVTAGAGPPFERWDKGVEFMPTLEMWWPSASGRFRHDELIPVWLTYIVNEGTSLRFEKDLDLERERESAAYASSFSFFWEGSRREPLPGTRVLDFHY